jgi:hypothetical protein
MSVFAGAFSRQPGVPVSPALREALKQNVSRFPGEAIASFGDERCFLAYVDLGAFDGEGVLPQAGSFTAVAGEALLREGDNIPGWNRSRELEVLQAALQAGDDSKLAQCCGTFCGVQYEAATGVLSLFSDRVGVRPLYVWTSPELVVFSTAMRVLEEVQQVRKELDVRGVSEMAAFHYPLSDRTPYRHIRMLKGSEVMRISATDVQCHAYARWTQEKPARPYEQLVQDGYDTFIRALRRRHRGSAEAAAFLSGGLDSRAIVGGLRAMGTEVDTINFAPEATQDRVFAKMVADLLHTRHDELSTDMRLSRRKEIVQEWLETRFSEGARPRTMWSGDGGSVSLGLVYMSPQIVEDMERGNVEQAVLRFNGGLAGRVLARTVRSKLERMPLQGAIEEIGEAGEGHEPARAFHLFLMANDQRRHMVQHFEDLDIERIEFQLPFFDGEFLEVVLSGPCLPFLGHAYYMDWLDKFPNKLASVPWQAYPGHVQCTLPMPEGLGYQWEGGYFAHEMVVQQIQRRIERSRSLLADRPFPRHLISRTVLHAATWVTRMGWRDYSYMLETASTFHKYWSICGRTANAPRI